MINFTHNNHLSYTIGGRQFGFRENPYEKYEVSVGRIDMDYFRKSSWLQEQYRIADLTYQAFGKDLVVMFSGGTDSEVVLRAYKHIGITPRAAFIRFIGGYNDHELIAAREVTDDLGINLEVIDFDVIDFYRSGYAGELASAVQSHNMAFVAVYSQILKLQAPAIMGGSFTFTRDPSMTGSDWKADFTECESASVRLSLKYSVPLIQEWFSYTPEVIGYFMEHPVFQRVVTDRYNYKNFTDSSKNPVFKEWMPSIIGKHKKNGYEYLTGLRHETDFFLKRLTRRMDRYVDGIPIEVIRIQLFGEQYGST